MPPPPAGVGPKEYAICQYEKGSGEEASCTTECIKGSVSFLRHSPFSGTAAHCSTTAHTRRVPPTFVLDVLEVPSFIRNVTASKTKYLVILVPVCCVPNVIENISSVCLTVCEDSAQHWVF
jgi:hypothetical protein